MAPPIDVLALAEARMENAWQRLTGAFPRSYHKAWVEAQDDWFRALDLARELQGADAN